MVSFPTMTSISWLIALKLISQRMTVYRFMQHHDSGSLHLIKLKIEPSKWSACLITVFMAPQVMFIYSSTSLKCNSSNFGTFARSQKTKFDQMKDWKEKHVKCYNRKKKKKQKNCFVLVPKGAQVQCVDCKSSHASKRSDARSAVLSIVMMRIWGVNAKII